MAVSDHSILYETWALAEEEHLDYCLLHSKKKLLCCGCRVTENWPGIEDKPKNISKNTF